MVKLLNTKIFLVSFLFSLIVVLAYFYSIHPETKLKIYHLSDSVYVTEQIKENDLDTIKRRVFTLLIDLRPDGEAADQAPSFTIKKLH